MNYLFRLPKRMEHVHSLLPGKTSFRLGGVLIVHTYNRNLVLHRKRSARQSPRKMPKIRCQPD